MPHLYPSYPPAQQYPRFDPPRGRSVSSPPSRAKRLWRQYLLIFFSLALILFIAGCGTDEVVQPTTVTDLEDDIVTEPTDIRFDPTVPQSPEYAAQYQSFKDAIAPYMTSSAGGSTALYSKDAGLIIIENNSGEVIGTLTLKDVGVRPADKVESLYAMTARTGRVLRTHFVIDGEEFYEDQPNS